MSNKDEISPRVKEIADKLESTMEVDTTTGVATAPKDAFEQTLPEDLDMKTVNKVYGHVEDVVSGLALATGHIGERVLKENEDLDKVSSEMSIPRHVEFSAHYERSRRGPKSVNDRTMVTRYGVTRTTVKTKAASSSRAELKRVINHLSERAEDLFS